MQPQLLQSGAPPNWHGVMRVSKSAEMQRVVFANTHSSGDCGGFAYTSINPVGAKSFGYRRRSAIKSVTTRSRSAGLRRSTELSPICGVYRLTQIFSTAACADQK